MNWKPGHPGSEFLFLFLQSIVPQAQVRCAATEELTGYVCAQTYKRSITFKGGDNYIYVFNLSRKKCKIYFSFFFFFKEMEDDISC